MLSVDHHGILERLHEIPRSVQCSRKQPGNEQRLKQEDRDQAAPALG